MRAFEKFEGLRFDHPEDMNTIIKYLEGQGRINIGYEHLENLYYDYSTSVCCGWRSVDEDSLRQFANFLTTVEVHDGYCKYVGNSYYD